MNKSAEVSSAVRLDLLAAGTVCSWRGSRTAPLGMDKLLKHANLNRGVALYRVACSRSWIGPYSRSTRALNTFLRDDWGHSIAILIRIGVPLPPSKYTVEIVCFARWINLESDLSVYTRSPDIIYNWREVRSIVPAHLSVEGFGITGEHSRLELDLYSI
jgi:hypothetical protein